jgi:D-alanyl-D-alanine carboxypeptidase/D-alanyl-D-alanine-endopeptidase (penicillin-binding protein 4)
VFHGLDCFTQRFVRQANFRGAIKRLAANLEFKKRPANQLFLSHAMPRNDRAFRGSLRCFVVLAVSIFLAAGSVLRAADALPRKIDEFLAQPHFKTAHFGWLFVDLAMGEIVLERNSDKLFVPASTTKLFSTAAALDALGADYRFRTPIYRRGNVNEAGVLDGDLILVASGDLTMGGRTTAKGEIALEDSDHIYANWAPDATLTKEDPLAGINELARQIAAAGIRRITGDVLIDDRLFEHTEGSGSGPSRITPIIVNDNVLDFTFEPTEPGQPAKTTWRPETALFQVEFDVQTVMENEPLETWIRPQSDGRIRVTGKIPANKLQVVRIYEVPDPAAFARGLLIEALRRKGVEVAAELSPKHPEKSLPERHSYDQLTKVAELVSPPFAENARLILKVSHNLHASTLPLLVAAKYGQRTIGEGMKHERDFLKQAGVDLDGVSFGGGAGGSRGDYVTPAAAVQLLRHMTTRPDFFVYERALPILGVDGTLAKAVTADSLAKGQAQAKTGTLSWENLLDGHSLCTSKALGGYLTTAKGKRLAFAAFVNGVHLKDGIDVKRLGRDLGNLCEIVHGER